MEQRSVAGVVQKLQLEEQQAQTTTASHTAASDRSTVLPLPLGTNTLRHRTGATTPAASPQNDPNRNHGKSAWFSLLRSIGLKRFAVTSKQERQKVIISGSRLISLTRTGVHVFPIIISVFLIALNGKVLLNGPNVTTGAVFFLQLAAKLHELTIVGSLTAIAFDLLRYHLLNDGINVGLIGSALSIATPSWLFTIDFLGSLNFSLFLQTFSQALNNLRAQFRTINIRSSPLALAQSKFFLCAVLVFCTFLAMSVGPASALLFVPTQSWVASASTDFYINGTPDMLWPQVLSSNHTGISKCSTSPIRTGMASCLNGGWKRLVAEAESINPIVPEWALYIAGGKAYRVPPATIINGALPNIQQNFSHGDPDTWAVTAHLAVASHADYLSHQAQVAFSKAKGRNRRLRDFPGSPLEIATGGKFPVVRVACSNLTEMHTPSAPVAFPVLTENMFWRPRTYRGSGPSKLLNATEFKLTNWMDPTSLDATTEMQVRAKWLSLPENLESGSATMLYLVQNYSQTYARGCSVEAWWSSGQTLRWDRSILFSWSVQAGDKSWQDSDEDLNIGLKDIFDSEYTPYYDKPIKIEQAWLDALAPMMPEASSVGNDLVMTSFEALLNQSYLNNLHEVLHNWEASGLDLEYMTSVFLINALSRIGLMYQLEFAHDVNLSPKLLSNDIMDDSFISGKNIYNHRNPSEPYVKAHWRSYEYGAAWSLTHPAQQGAVAILCVHILLALLHTLVLLMLKRSSEAWDSVSELLVLAYNSTPRPGVFHNCSSGIKRACTLRKKLKVLVQRQNTGDYQAELFTCDDQTQNDAEKVLVDRAYS